MALAPRHFGRYTLLKRIARGGMGQVFLAAHRRAGGADRPCAIKTVLRGRSYDVAQRFREEGWLLVSMNHPNVVDVFEMGRVGLEFYLAMELVQGRDLGQVMLAVLRQRKLVSLAAALYIIRELLAAVSYCHQHTDEFGAHLGLIHRDISPGNILLSHDGELKLADFGLAQSTRKLAHTQPEIVLGKIGYMAPERLVGPSVDQRADIFSVGVVLFELLAGKRYAPAERPEEYLHQLHLRSQRRGSLFCSDVPWALVRIAAQALSVDPGRRYSSAAHFQREVSALLSQIAPAFGAADFAREVMAPNFSAGHDRQELQALLQQARGAAAETSHRTGCWPLPRLGDGGAAQEDEQEEGPLSGLALIPTAVGEPC